MLESPFRLVRQMLPHMYDAGWGRVVNISSAHGLRASPFKSAYVTAKHGLEGLSKVIALEGAAHGVTSNCVNPAYVRTPLVEKQIADQARQPTASPRPRSSRRSCSSPVAVKRLIEPAEVAELVAVALRARLGLDHRRVLRARRRLDRALSRTTAPPARHRGSSRAPPGPPAHRQGVTASQEHAHVPTSARAEHPA